MKRLNQWIPIDDKSIPKSVKFINCDTRDFHIYLSTTKSNYANDIISIADTSKCIFVNDILALLKHLKKITGGEGDWRHIELKDNTWLKYIWFIRYTDDLFIMSTRDGKQLDPKKIVELIDFSNPYVMTE